MSMWGAAPMHRRGLVVCAITHAAVDAGCGYLLWHAVGGDELGPERAWGLFVTYSALAFAVQPVIGALVDGRAARRAATLWQAVVLGTSMVLVALCLPADWLAMAVLLAGLGNATFHVGGGVLALRMAPGRATHPGLFVAPGAAGLAAGIAAGRAGLPAGVIMVMLLLSVGASLWAGQPRSNSHPGQPARLPDQPASGVGGLTAVLLVLLAVVAARAYVGSGVALPWRTSGGWVVALPLAVVVGKAAGGVLADRWGWRPVACGALLTSLPLLAVGTEHAVAGVIGILLFNMTMPVTVTAAALLLPGDEGLAFGLTCLALFVGSIPSFLGMAVPLSALGLAGAIAGTAAGLWWVLGYPLVRPSAAGSAWSARPTAGQLGIEVRAERSDLST